MTNLEPAWEPLGVADSREVVDARAHIRHPQDKHPPPTQHRADVDVLHHRLRFTQHGRSTLSASVLGLRDDGESMRILKSLDGMWGRGPGGIVWDYYLLPLDVLGRKLDVERATDDKGWMWQVTGAPAGQWTWRPEGRFFADRMVLRREGETEEPLVTCLLRPVPGRRSTGEHPVVSWTPKASLAEVAVCVAWHLSGAWRGLLPKAQRLKTLDFL